MKKGLMAVSVIALSLALGLSAAQAQTLPGATVSERAVAGAKQYIKDKNLKDPKITILLNSLFKNAQPRYNEEWEKLTGVKIESIPLGYTDIPAKVMAEAVAKTGVYDIFNDFPYTIPDAVGAGVLAPLDAWIAKGKPDYAGIAPAFLGQQAYRGKQYAMTLDGDHLMLVLRKDLVENPQARAEYQQRFGKALGCPETMKEWEQQAAFFHTEKGKTRWGITFDQPLYGAMGYRAINFSYRHFPAYLGALAFDKDMKPQIDTPNGIRAIKEFVSIVKYMPTDIQGWNTAQIYPFWGSGQVYSVMSFPSIVGFGEKNPSSKVATKQLPCLVPQVEVNGKLARRIPQAAGTSYMVNKYSKHPELAYYFMQWLASPEVGDRAVADAEGFWDPFRESQRNNAKIVDKYGSKEFLNTTLDAVNQVVSLLWIQGNYEYFKILDNQLADVMSGNITAEEAAKRIAKGWDGVTEDVGRKEQIEAWRAGVESGIYIDKF
ncbi:MAG: extracellular solute-binding protein [Variibacter sp.]|nr:extracellular solute-binding protein [Variibacter sp.]